MTHPPFSKANKGLELSSSAWIDLMPAVFLALVSRFQTIRG
ncbi:hypothetical protein HHE03_11200 [Helicobacter heilmannii]|nr:hypothetical protein BN341_7670 [Helicobacter heilmannii ASB1.4]CRF49503.1 hypothetical protein HHE03_11200 [Helicobacter heilmannii]